MKVVPKSQRAVKDTNRAALLRAGNGLTSLAADTQCVGKVVPRLFPLSVSNFSYTVTEKAVPLNRLEFWDPTLACLW